MELRRLLACRSQRSRPDLRRKTMRTHTKEPGRESGRHCQAKLAPHLEGIMLREYFVNSSLQIWSPCCQQSHTLNPQCIAHMPLSQDYLKQSNTGEAKQYRWSSFGFPSLQPEKRISPMPTAEHSLALPVCCQSWDSDGRNGSKQVSRLQCVCCINLCEMVKLQEATALDPPQPPHFREDGGRVIKVRPSSFYAASVHLPSAAQILSILY